ncbi:MAG: TRAP transporter small permease [Clostridia bacterium]|nr:TRAP transporter small permease [Clostridia bacterium]
MKAYKVYKKIMDGFTLVEKLVLAITLLVVTAITFGNVLSRYLLPTSWSFTEELVINTFVLLSLLGAALCARDEGGLVSMSLFSGKLSRKGQRIINILMTIFGLLLCYVLIKNGADRVASLIANHKRTDVLRIFEWKFALFVPVSGACMALHLIEFAVDNIHFIIHGEKEDDDEGQGEVANI